MKNNKDEERPQPETLIPPLKKSVPAGGLATPPKVVVGGGVQQNGEEGWPMQG